MNRRDKQRMDDRRREANAPKKTQYDLNSSNSSKNLMDNYFQSQKVIQSLSETSVGINDVNPTKSFKIPKKQPAKVDTNRNNRMTSAREQYNSRTSHNRRNSLNGDRGDDFDNCRRNLDNDRGEKSRNFQDERRRGDQVIPKRDSFDRRNDNFPAKRNEHTPRTTEERRRRDEVFTKKGPNDESVDPVRPRREPHTSELNRARHLNHSKRIPLDSPARRDRFRRRKPELKPNNVCLFNEEFRLKNRLYFNQPIEVIIADRAAPNGKISPENVQMFLNVIEESVAQRVLTDPTYQTKFIGHRHEGGLLTMTCADDFTTVFIQQKLTEDLPLWPGAKLECSLGHFKSCFINVVIPNSIGHISHFLSVCKQTDSRMLTEKWRRIECQNADDDSGKLFKLAIDKKSYELMKEQGNVVLFGNTSIKIELDALIETPDALKPST